MQPAKVTTLDIAKHDVYKQSPKYNILCEEKVGFDPRVPNESLKEEERYKAFFDRLRKSNPNASVLLTLNQEKDFDYPPSISVIAVETKYECKKKSEAELTAR